MVSPDIGGGRIETGSVTLRGDTHQGPSKAIFVDLDIAPNINNNKLVYGLFAPPNTNYGLTWANTSPTRAVAEMFFPEIGTIRQVGHRQNNSWATPWHYVAVYYRQHSGLDFYCGPWDAESENLTNYEIHNFVINFYVVIQF